MGETMKGRPVQRPPALAFEYRRHITLVQVLALGDDRAVYELARKWGLSCDGWEISALITRLAQLATDVDRARKERP